MEFQYLFRVKILDLYPLNLEDNMRKILYLFCLLFPVILLQAQTKNFIDQPYIEVAGSADTLVTPDEIFIRINISEKDTKNKVSVEALEG